MKHIDSAANPQFKQLARLATEARERRETQRVWLEGLRLTEAGLVRAHHAHDQLVLAESTIQAAQEPGSRLGALIERALDQQLPILSLADKLFEHLSQVDSHQGVGLVLERPPDALPSSCSDWTDFVVIDRLQDPGNLGSLLRTAAAAGIRHVLLMRGSTEAFSPKALRSGMGAQLSLSVIEDLAPGELSDWLHRLGIPLVLTVAAHESEALSLYESQGPLAQPQTLAWAFGQEGAGLSEDLRAIPSALRLHIPQSTAVESLNVAAAAAVCLFERRRRCLMAQRP